MKKLIAILVVFAIVTGAAFAQVAGGMYVNAWGQGAFLPLVLETAPKANGEKVKDLIDEELGAKSYVGVGPVWGGNAIAAQFNVGGWSENIGWYVGVQPAWVGGNIWARPFGNDYLKVTIGDYCDDTLRGTGGVNMLGDFILAGAGAGGGGGDSIFSRIGTDVNDGVKTTYGPQGFMLSSMPVSGLFIGLNVNTDGAGLRFSAPDAYRNMQAAIGYNISGIGLIRAQWIGGWLGTKDITDEKTAKIINRQDFSYDTSRRGTFAAIQAAFKLTAVEGLTLDIGYKFYFPITLTQGKDVEGGFAKGDIAKFAKNMEIGFIFKYNLDAFNIALGIDAFLGGYERVLQKEILKSYGLTEDTSKNPVRIDARLTPSYEFDFAKIGLDVGFTLSTDSQGIILSYDAENPDKYSYKVDKKGDGTWQISFGAWIEKGLGPGSILAGVTYSMAPFAKDKDGKFGANGSGVLQIPVVLTYAFF